MEQKSQNPKIQNPKSQNMAAAVFFRGWVPLAGPRQDPPPCASFTSEKVRFYVDLLWFLSPIPKNNNFIIICKNQTCSDKMKTFEDIKKYLIENSIN